MKNWYIVQSHSSFENKVAGLIKEEAEKAKISDKFEEIVVPTHDVTEVKRGEKNSEKKEVFSWLCLN
jgi:transcriptional antiterminator NusG